MKRHSSFLFFLLIASNLIWATVPTGYYTNANGKNTNELRTALKAIISNGASDVGYAGLWAAYATTDLNSAGKIWDMYSNCSFTFSTKQCGNYSVECDCYNREHTSPQSWFAEAAPMVSDLFNVYPTDGKVNGERSNFPYGEVGTPTYTSGNGCKLGNSSFTGYSGIVFEPIDEYKGDFARTFFYMATRYAGLCESWANGAEVVYGSTNLGLTSYAAELFLKWSRQDPISAKETLRNDAVYGIQNNRNPFIDYPGLEEFIWGNNTTGTFSTSGTTVSAPTVISPTAANITATTALLGGNISATGNASISESGIYHSTNTGFINGTGTKVTATATSIGAFTTTATNLNASTNYYYKAFATNSVGTAYSSQGSFTTAMPPPPPSIFARNDVGTGTTLNFGLVSASTNKSLFIKTSSLTGDLIVVLTGDMFSTSTTTITKVEAETGYTLSVTYNPTATGSHTGILSITGGGLPNGYSIALAGKK